MTGEELATGEGAERATESRQGASSSSRGRAVRSRALDGRYHSLLLAGRGGMGAVEIALERDEASGFRRVVALKRLLPDAARDRRHADMFLREAKVAQLLAHENVVRAFDAGEADGELYIAMEYVEGQPLSRVLSAVAKAGESISPAVVAFVLAEVCEGLHAAHELEEGGEKLNLVHRDVSPQNVMLAYDGSVKLLDFGVAKIETESVTKTGEVKGKTAYMSPEQAMGDALDRRSDLFGVGALLFECLTLRRMWGDGTDMEVIRKLALEEPPPLEAGEEAAPLAGLYAELVAKERTARPESAAAVAARLRDAAGGVDGRAEVRALMERHFGENARERRRELTRAMDAVEGAADLRESLTPGTPTPAPSSRRAVPAIDAETTTPAARARAPLFLLAGAAVFAVAWVALRDSSPSTPPVSSTPTLSTSAATPTPTLSTSAATPTPPVSSTPTPSTSAAPPTPTLSTSAAPSPRPPPVSATRPPAPPPTASIAPRPSASAPATRPTGTVRLNVDEKPF